MRAGRTVSLFHHGIFLVLLMGLCLLGACENTEDNSNAPEGTPVFSPAAVRPEASVLPNSVDDCEVFQETTCVEGRLRRCDIYDVSSRGWVDDPDPMLAQAYWYDRYYDLYHRMEGQHSDLEFTVPMWPGTPESVWGDPQYFREYDGFGDGSGWTGTALWAAAARYRVTGTDADYNRMLDQFESMAFLYEATGIPGLLMRSHFAMLEEGAPRPVGNPGKAVTTYIEPHDWHFRYPLAGEYLARLPSYYTEGVEIGGTHYDVTPVWMGDASRDMYVRSLPGVMLAYDMLGDGAAEARLRQVIERSIPCTLRRMKKMRITNLQSNPILLEWLRSAAGAGRLILDPDDIDLFSLDTLYGYVMEQPNSCNMEAFEAECPDDLPWDVEPAYDLDASKWIPFFMKFFDILMRLQNEGGEPPIAWIQLVSVRGSDILFMTQWALAAHYLTGEEQYLKFLEQLMEELEYWPVIDTYGSFWSPKWCRPHFGPSLLYPTLWNLQTRIDGRRYPDFWTRLGTAIMEESRMKELEQANEALFGILYDNMVDASIDPDGHAHALEMVEMLREMGQYQVADKFEPRRNYTVDLVNDPPPGVELEELTQEEYDMCTQPVTFFGIEIAPGWIEDELPRAVEGLPLPYRVPGSFLWAMDPFMLRRDYGGGAAKKQWPMVSMTLPFWVGRLQGTIEEGEGMALAWRDTGEVCGE